MLFLPSPEGQIFALLKETIVLCFPSVQLYHLTLREITLTSIPLVCTDSPGEHQALKTPARVFNVSKLFLLMMSSLHSNTTSRKIPARFFLNYNFF